MRNRVFEKTIFSLLILAITVYFLAPISYAEYSAMDKKNKAKLEKEIKELRNEVKTAKSEVAGKSKAEFGAYLKNAKGVGKSRSDKFNTGRDYYEATQAKHAGAKNYDKIKERYESLKVRLDQLEFELKELKAKEKSNL